MNTEFSNEQFLSIYPPGIENHYWTLARNKIIESCLDRNNLKNKKILEIGCGRGVVTKFLRDRGADCLGVDLSDIEVEPELEGFIYSGMDFKSLDRSLINQVEVVMLLDVIEHISDVGVFLKDIKDTFPKLSHIFITVPARKELWSNYDEFNGHFRRYDIDDLTHLSSAANFRIIELSYFFHLLYIMASLVMVYKKKRSTQVVPPNGLLVWLHKVLGEFFVFEKRFFPRRMFGSSLICLVAV